MVFSSFFCALWLVLYYDSLLLNMDELCIENVYLFQNNNKKGMENHDASIIEIDYIAGVVNNFKHD